MQWLEQATSATGTSLLNGQSDAPLDWQAVLEHCQDLSQQQSSSQAELTESMAQQVKGFNRFGEKLLHALQQHLKLPMHYSGRLTSWAITCTCKPVKLFIAPG